MLVDEIQRELYIIDEVFDGYQFEAYCAKLLSLSGFSNVSITSASHDFGIDIFADKDGMLYAFQCKKYKGNVGTDAIQEVLSGRLYYNRHIAVVLTNSDFTGAAKELAEKTGVWLWNRSSLISLISASPMTFTPRDADGVSGRFRGTYWGMPQAEVEALENEAGRNAGNTLVYSDRSFLGIPCTLFYTFNSLDLLLNGGYIIQTEDVYNCFEFIKQRLTQIYGAFSAPQSDSGETYIDLVYQDTGIMLSMAPAENYISIVFGSTSLQASPVYLASDGLDVSKVGNLSNEGDPLLNEAIRCVYYGQATASCLQRGLNIGYARAARLLESMADLGIVGPFQGSAPRSIYITEDQWKNYWDQRTSNRGW